MTYYVPDTNLDTGDTAENEIKPHKGLAVHGACNPGGETENKDVHGTVKWQRFYEQKYHTPTANNSNDDIKLVRSYRVVKGSDI